MTSDSTATGSFAEIIRGFAATIADNFRQPIQAQPEDQLKGPVGELLRATGQLTGRVVGWRTEVHADDISGRPDIGVTTDGLLTGHVELKRPGLGARAEQFTGPNHTQWERFKALPNLIYTDGAEWSLYRSGELKLRVRIAADVSEGGAKAVALESLKGSVNCFATSCTGNLWCPGRRRDWRSSSLPSPVSSGTTFRRRCVGKAVSSERWPKSGLGCYSQREMRPSLPMPMHRPLHMRCCWPGLRVQKACNP